MCLIMLTRADLFVPLGSNVCAFLVPMFFFVSKCLFSFSQGPICGSFVGGEFERLVVPCV